MKTNNHGKVVLLGCPFDNPLDEGGTYPKKDYQSGKESARITYEKIALDLYPSVGSKIDKYGSYELKVLSNGRAFIDGHEIKNQDEIKTAQELIQSVKKLKFV